MKPLLIEEWLIRAECFAACSGSPKFTAGRWNLRHGESIAYAAPTELLGEGDEILSAHPLVSIESMHTRAVLEVRQGSIVDSFHPTPAPLLTSIRIAGPVQLRLAVQHMYVTDFRGVIVRRARAR